MISVGHCFPVYLNLTEQLCVVIGGGKVAARKVSSLIACDAKVKVISPQVSKYLETAENAGKITICRRKYRPEDINGAFIVISATDNEELNLQVAVACSLQNIPVNIVNAPAKGSFIVPAVVRRGSLAIAVSTDGKSPSLARKIKEDLEKQFGNEYAEFLEIMGELRNLIINNVQEIEKRSKIFREIIESDILNLLREGQTELVKERINNVLGSSGLKS